MGRVIILLALVIIIPVSSPAGTFCSKSLITDTDGDGFSDEIEKKIGSDPNKAEEDSIFLDDLDHDGLNNLQELEAGTDPTDPDTDDDALSDAQEVRSGNSNPCSKDTDMDGSSDFHEIIDGTYPLHPDTDGDGWLDGAERNTGSDPNDPSSTPKKR